MAATECPFLGYGVGLRRDHFDSLWDHADSVDFFEVLCENVMGFGGRPREVARQVASRFPTVLHGVALSIGSFDPLNDDYVTRLGALGRELGAHWFSDHLCFSSAHGVDYHDLIPVPFTDEAVKHVAGRIREATERVELPFALENPSYYIEYEINALDEASFLTQIVEEADCQLLLDVNNVFVNASNHGYDPYAFIDALPHERVCQIHMAGHDVQPNVIIDTHGAPVVDEVLDLYRYTIERTGPVSTLLEWDHNIPDMAVLVDELARIRAAGEAVTQAKGTAVPIVRHTSDPRSAR